MIVDAIVELHILSLTDAFSRDRVHHFWDENLLDFCAQTRVGISLREMSFFLIFFDVFESEVAKRAQPAKRAKVVKFTVFFRMSYF